MAGRLKEQLHLLPRHNLVPFCQKKRRGSMGREVVWAVWPMGPPLGSAPTAWPERPAA